MNISGLQKITLLDYPEKVAATVFTGGCNFRCPFCHNSSFVINPNNNGIISEEEFFDFLMQRKGFLDGVCISGGEPLLQKDIIGFIRKIKDIRFLVKLDTNGSFPDKLRKLIKENLIDYVAMDIKNSPASYAKTAGTEEDILSKVKESVDILLKSGIDYEFRTTVVKNFHTKEDFIEIGKWIYGAKRYFLQYFVDSGDLIESGLEAVEKSEMEGFKDVVQNYVPEVFIRGI